MYYDRDGTEISVGRYIELFNDLVYRRVAATQIGRVRVSTVWLGADHSFGGGRPVIFETMIFGGGLHLDQERYCTLEEAHFGHADVVARVRARPLEAWPALTRRAARRWRMRVNRAVRAFGHAHGRRGLVGIRAELAPNWGDKQAREWVAAWCTVASGAPVAVLAAQAERAAAERAAVASQMINAMLQSLRPVRPEELN